MDFKLLNRASGGDVFFTNQKIADFLHTHLEQYGDTTEDILKCLAYVFADGKGGNIILGIEENEIIGAVVLNNTNMAGYIPENILVYIALHKDHRGKGLGKGMMKEAIRIAKGSIALHVEPDNPAFHLYKKLGFENKYLEMRLTRHQ